MGDTQPTLERAKMELVAQLLDPMILGDMLQHPIIKNIVRMTGLKVSLLATLTSTNDLIMSSFVTLAKKTMSTAQDEQVDYSTFAQSFGEDLLAFKELLEREKKKKMVHEIVDAVDSTTNPHSPIRLHQEEKQRYLNNFDASLETRQEISGPSLDTSTTATELDIPATSV